MTMFEVMIARAAGLPVFVTSKHYYNEWRDTPLDITPKQPYRHCVRVINRELNEIGQIELRFLEGVYHEPDPNNNKV